MVVNTHTHTDHIGSNHLTVNRWLDDGDGIILDDRELFVIHTPGEAENHICIFDKVHRLLFCGDILMHGPIWTHLEGGDLDDLIASYEKLMHFNSDFDYLIPSHNRPVFDKDLLPDALTAAKKYCLKMPNMLKKRILGIEE